MIYQSNGTVFLDIRVNPDTDEITIANTGKNDLTVYLYEME